jgi:hypothetical protein
LNKYANNFRGGKNNKNNGGAIYTFGHQAKPQKCDPYPVYSCTKKASTCIAVNSCVKTGGVQTFSAGFMNLTICEPFCQTPTPGESWELTLLSRGHKNEPHQNSPRRG